MLHRIAKRIITQAARRAPDFVIGGAMAPYLRRWWITPWSGAHMTPPGRRTRWQRIGARLNLPGIYLHQVLRSDDDRALHDHPWANCSILLRGSYLEHTIRAGGIHVRTRRKAGAVVFRWARAAHRLEIDAGECWSLFLTGPRTRAWGFHCPHGWVPWREFTAADDPGSVGLGCGDV